VWVLSIFTEKWHNRLQNIVCFRDKCSIHQDKKGTNTCCCSTEHIFAGIFTPHLFSGPRSLLTFLRLDIKDDIFSLTHMPTRGATVVDMVGAQQQEKDIAC